MPPRKWSRPHRVATDDQDPLAWQIGAPVKRSLIAYDH